MLYVGQETAKPEESCWDPLALFACKEQWAPFAELLDSTYRARSSQDRSALQTMIWTLPSRLSLLGCSGRIGCRASAEQSDLFRRHFDMMYRFSDMNWQRKGHQL